jgi:ABC-type lipoprotein release transport system permease subunit
MALGAERHAVLRQVMSEGMRLCAVGVLVGLLGSVAVARAIRALLVGVPAVDVPTLTSVCAMLVAVAALASIIPARRAMGVSPTEALRG